DDARFIPGKGRAGACFRLTEHYSERKYKDPFLVPQGSNFTKRFVNLRSLFPVPLSPQTDAGIDRKIEYNRSW
ncbi:MAG TPA: hypothetical protein VFA10_14180, partial [Ktedonobacteraceae bacterium]|nr:hypothetical protein [Ktedonobacteraceae bacterium]